jgi:hypothetical protein
MKKINMFVNKYRIYKTAESKLAHMATLLCLFKSGLLTGFVLSPVCACSLAPSTLVVPQQEASHRVVRSTFRAEGSSAATIHVAAAGGEGARTRRGLYVRANEPFARGGVGNPASHILL